MILFQSTFQGLPSNAVSPGLFTEGGPDEVVLGLAVRLEDASKGEELCMELGLEIDNFL